MHAVACKHDPGCSCEKAIEKLVHHEADINATTGPHNETALHQAAASGNDQMVSLLLSKEADKDASAPHTPLLVAVKNNQTLTADMLLDAGADPNLLNADKWSMLHHAVNSNAFDVLLTLLSSKHKDKINIESKSSTGGTALLLAAERASKPQNHALAEALLRKNADVNAVDSFGRSALYFATNGPRNTERENFVRLLMKYGADPALTPPKFRARFGQYMALKQANTELKKIDSGTGSESGSKERVGRGSFSRELGVSRRDSGTTVSSVVSGGVESVSTSPRSGLFGLKLGRKNSGK
jgi:ankyrin repeat protein